MRLLLDTHIVLAVVDGSTARRFPNISQMLQNAGVTGYVSVASLWEIAIKTRLGKLSPSLPVEAIPSFLLSTGLNIIAIDVPHVLIAVDPVPITLDPFDRLLLAQCHIEAMLLVTVDRALTDHRLAWRPGV
ncbi:type II toxin-antitoxin system VapC family toxin [Rhizobium tubonense]|uniref:PIN domain nuclease n=1 Tax=Rhizobium tubonense TaxID=484088 RepID=A0A2W4CLT0_9HYPH|nr:type II toxin-antitoxin system VapC family toxin [Rhizobium tubonense]PZM13759.1 PIN domain nuclease [Rhizobium tubonense]